VRIAVLADMGSIELFGWMVAEELIREHTASPFDMVFISGDLRRVQPSLGSAVPALACS
jgi:hypothetical protein